jgi:hypothetical protein
MVMLLLASSFLAIVGAAQPYRTSHNAARPLMIVVDCGITMSAGQKTARFQDLALLLQPLLQKRFGPQQRVDIYQVPGRAPIRATVADWAGRLSDFPKTALDTRPLLASTLRQLLAHPAGSVIVLSDQSLKINDPRLVQLSPNPPLSAVGISAIGARLVPHPQVLVRLRNQSLATQTMLIVQSGDQERGVPLNLSPAPGEQTVFVDFSSLHESVHARLEPNDAGWPAAQAWLVRQNRPIRVRALSAISPEMRRMIRVYNDAQPASDDPVIVAVGREGSPLPANQPAAIIASNFSASLRPTINGQRPTVVTSPLTEHVQWNRVLASARLASLPQGDWQVLVSSAGQPALAVATGGSRRVWVGIDSPRWSQSPDYVIFWKNVFDYLGGGQPIYSAGTVHAAPRLQPGLYRGSDGHTEALNAPDVFIPSPAHHPWREQLAHLPRSAGEVRNVSKWFFLSALICAVAAMWPGQTAIKRHAPAGMRSTPENN